ncbi:MAG: type III-A CRISPR-associated protein Cas10/Csm1 [Dictyoglomaceae bacterium]|nr:type III-A CRISPR-associated protein Cas10/Csm1 [Dictyoglomaceae bacterium]
MDDIKILLSALFHDLGKVLERTKEYKSKELPYEFQKVNYAHPKFSAFFLKTLIKSSENLSPFLRENITEEVVDLVLTHHTPENEYGFILQISDWLASSEREEDEFQRNHYTNVALSSIFKKIDNNAEELVYPLDTLQNTFPLKRENIKIDENCYQKLIEPFLRIFPKISDIEQLLTLFEYYFSQTPAQTTGFNPDISIYDHSRITAGLAHSLYKNLKENILDREELIKIREALRYKEKEKEILNKPLFTLISGDLSGIQSFLFNVSSERAGRMLKGKSVFLDLLMRYSAKYILDNTGFTKVNTIYIGGGNFDLLISYTPDEKLSKLREYIIENLWKLIGEELYLGIEWIHLSISDLFNFIEKKEELINKLNERKKRKFGELSKFYELIITPRSENIGEGDYCTICGKKKVYDASAQDKWCITCKSFIDFTDILKNNKYLIEEKTTLEKDPETVEEFFENLGYRIKFSKEFQFTKGKIYQFENIFIEENHIPHGFLLGSFNIYESEFNKIAEKNIINGYGDRKLAYLKMDADNMGNILKKLSEEENKREGLSLTRYGVLSRRIELFFGKEVLELINNNKEFFYPVFIGGDDLFIIGSYNEINKLILEIREKYRNYTGSKDVFTISAGVSYLSDNFPLIRGAGIVEEALEKAKSFKYPEEENPKKDKICIENEVLTYNEFLKALEISEELSRRIIKQKEASRAIITKIENSLKGFNPLLEQSLKKKVKPPAIWRFMYYLRDYEDIAKKLENIILDNLFERGEKIRNPRLIMVSTKIAKMKTRRG